jgi:hypothetical protein
MECGGVERKVKNKSSMSLWGAFCERKRWIKSQDEGIMERLKTHEE